MCGGKGVSLLFDPYVPLPGAAYEMLAEGFLPAPHILITHGHVDHVGSVPDILEQGAGEVYATASPCAGLLEQGVLQEKLQVIEPGAVLSLGDTPEVEKVLVTVKRGKHIHFDIPLVLGTLLHPRMLRYWGNAKALVKANRIFQENDETVIYEVSDGTKLVTVLGSLSLNDEEHYTQNPNLLILPYQGSSHLLPIALSIVEQLAPQSVLLDHFDDAFPPVSRTIDTSPFVEAMAQQHPEIPVIIPQRGSCYEVQR